MIWLSEAGELVCRGQIFVAQRCINCKWEENVIVDVDVLLNRLVGVQGGKFFFDDCLGSCQRCVDKVLVHFDVSAIFLHSIHVGVRVEGSNCLEFLVPLSVLFWVEAISGIDNLTHTFRRRYLDLLLFFDEPWVDWLDNGWDKVGLTLQNRWQIGLQVSAKGRAQLI